MASCEGMLNSSCFVNHFHFPNVRTSVLEGHLLLNYNKAPKTSLILVTVSNYSCANPSFLHTASQQDRSDDGLVVWHGNTTVSLDQLSYPGNVDHTAPYTHLCSYFHQIGTTSGTIGPKKEDIFARIFQYQNHINSLDQGTPVSDIDPLPTSNPVEDIVISSIPDIWCTNNTLEIFPNADQEKPLAPGNFLTGPLLLTAAKDGDIDSVETIARFITDIDYRDSRGETALHKAAGSGHIEIMSLLLELGAFANFAEEDGYTALHWGAQQGSVEMVRLLLVKGASIDATTDEGLTALHVASYNGHTEVVEVLLGDRADIDITADEGLTALHWAAKEGYAEVVELLLEDGAEIDAVTDEDFTALHVAAYGGHFDVVGLLLELGAEINAKGDEGLTALHAAVEGGHIAVAELLLEEGADIHAVTSAGDTPLHEAACGGYIEIVRLLLEQGANLDATNRAGQTPLHQVLAKATPSNITEARTVVELLLAQGADMSKSNNQGKTPVALARMKIEDNVVFASLELPFLPYIRVRQAFTKAAFLPEGAKRLAEACRM